MELSQHSTPATAQRRSGYLSKRERNWGLIFLAPWIIGFVLFFLGPMIASLLLSFTSFELLHPEAVRFVGLDNWKQMFVDPLVRQSLLVTGRFLLISVPLLLGLALGLALLVNSRHLFGARIFRLLFYMPMMVPAVAGTIIWFGMLNPQSGWFNGLLAVVGVQRCQAGGQQP